VTPTELLALLQDCYAARLRLMLRHEAVARNVGQFDFNNTYQYVIAREETHLSWLRAAIEELGRPVRVSSSREVPPARLSSFHFSTVSEAV